MSRFHSVPWLGVPVLSFSRSVLTNVYLLPFAWVGKGIRLTAWNWEDGAENPTSHPPCSSSCSLRVSTFFSAWCLPLLSLAPWWAPLEALRFELLYSAKSLPSFHPLVTFRVKEVSWIHGIWACIFISLFGINLWSKTTGIWLFHHLETRGSLSLLPPTPPPFLGEDGASTTE